MHRVEEVFALCVDADAEALALRAEVVFERGHRFARARDVGDDDHRKLALYDRLVDVNDAAPGLCQNLRDPGHDARMIHAEDRDDEAVRAPLRLPSRTFVACVAGTRAVGPAVGAEAGARSASGDDEGRSDRLIISVFGVDHPGIVAGVSQVLAEARCSIADINQTVVSGKFAMVIVADISQARESAAALKDHFRKEGERLGVRIYAQREDLFNAMHRI